MPKKSIKYYIKELLSIAGPIIMGNLGFIMIGVGDIIVAGRHSTDTFAAISIAAAIVNCIMTFAIGLTSAVSPLLSNYRGENKPVKRYFYPSIRFALVLAFLSSLAILFFVPLIPALGFEQHLVKPIQQYMLISALSTFGGSLHHVVKEFLQAFEIVLFPNIVTILCVFLNLALNFVFVFGWGIIPSMGTVGLAVSSLIVRYVMGLTLLGYCYTRMSFKNYGEKNYYKNLIKIGLPISMAIMVEFVAFNSVAILTGRIAGVYAAAQNLVCTLTTVSFMIPFAVSNAIAVKVGFANGSGNKDDLKMFSYTGVAMSVIFMAFSAVVFLCFPRQIIGIFTSDENLFKIAVPIVYILPLFQLFDGLQISLSGICKGIKQTEIILLANFLAYWCVSIPIGCYLGLYLKLNLVGFWIGLVCASIILCLVMLAKLNAFWKRN